MILRRNSALKQRDTQQQTARKVSHSAKAILKKREKHFVSQNFRYHNDAATMFV